MRVLLVGLSLLVGACGPSTSSIEQRIEAELPGRIGPADRYDVQVDGVQVARRRVSRVVILGEGVRPTRGGPRVDRLVLELDGVRVDRRGREVEQVERASGSARLLPADLAAFLETNESVRQAQVRLSPPDGATVRLRPDLDGLVLPAGVSAEVSGRFVADAGAVRFEVASVRALGASLGSGAVERVSRAINPIVDLAGTPADVTVERVHVDGGALVIEATARPAGMRFR